MTFFTGTFSKQLSSHLNFPYSSNSFSVGTKSDGTWNRSFFMGRTHYHCTSCTTCTPYGTVPVWYSVHLLLPADFTCSSSLGSSTSSIDCLTVRSMSPVTMSSTFTNTIRSIRMEYLDQIFMSLTYLQARPSRSRGIQPLLLAPTHCLHHPGLHYLAVSSLPRQC